MAAAELINDIDRYEILSTLGQGGFGSVFLARHRMTGREVALKVSNPQGDPELLARALNEARIAATIRHPSLVDVFDCGTLADGRIFVAMERVEGRSLDSILEDERRISTERAVALCAQVLSALDAVHARGIVHRDIKPSNLLVRREPDGTERVFIIDFGISKVLQTSSVSQLPHGSQPIAQPGTMVGAILGTPGYMPPEQLDARSVDARADLYAVGVVLFRALSGRLPFEAQTLAEWFVAITQAPMPPLATVAPWVSAGVCAVVDRAIARDRDARPPSASVMRDWLLSAMSGAPGFSQPPQPPHTAKLPASNPSPAPSPSHSHTSYAHTAHAQSAQSYSAHANAVVPRSSSPASMVAPAQPSASYAPNVALAQPTRASSAQPTSAKPAFNKQAIAIITAAAVLTTVILLGVARPWETDAPDDVTTVTNPTQAHPASYGASAPMAPMMNAAPNTVAAAPAVAPAAVAPSAPAQAPTAPAMPAAPTNSTPPTPSTAPAQAQPANTSPMNGLLAALGATPPQNAQETAGDTAILRSPSGRLRFTESRRVGDVDMSEAIDLVRRAMPSIEPCHGGSGPAHASITMMFRATASPVFSQPSSVGGALARCIETAIDTSNPQMRRGTRSGGILADMTFEWR